MYLVFKLVRLPEEEEEYRSMTGYPELKYSRRRRRKVWGIDLENERTGRGKIKRERSRGKKRKHLST